MEECLAAAVQESLALCLYDNARFLAERLVAMNGSESNLCLLASCYYHSNQAYKAYYTLHGFHSAQSRYLFALACIQMGKYSEARDTLAKQGEQDVPMGAAGLYLLGKVNRYMGRSLEAKDNFVRALKLNPLLWSAYQELCELGGDAEAAGICASFVSPDVQQSSVVSATPAQGSNPQQPAFGIFGQFQTPMPAAFITPAMTGPSTCSTPSPAGLPLAAPAPPQKGQQPVPFPGFSTSSAMPTDTPHLEQRNARLMDEGKVRKVSGKLFQEPPTSVRRSSRIAALQGTTTPATELTAQPPHNPQPTHTLQPSFGTAALTSGPQSSSAGDGSSSAARSEGLQALLKMLMPILEGFRHLCSYNTQEALNAFRTLPVHQFRTAWVYCQVARAHFERMEYVQAVQNFEHARSLDKYRVEGMDLYSTVLWHLRKEYELSFLAQEMVALDRLSPQTWCVMGNFFSSQKDHEAAIEYFQRALQLDPHFTYAHTLMGHEHFANEDFDKAMQCYRSAYKEDPRHYNALYGMGQICFRQEKHSEACSYFMQATKVNPRSSVLHCYQGMALGKMGQPQQALSKLAEAIQLDPKNPLARYERAQVLLSLDRADEAATELEQLLQLAPAETSVLFLLGKVHKRLGNQQAALRYMETALSFKSSSADLSVIKAAIEKLDIDEDEEEDDL